MAFSSWGWRGTVDELQWAKMAALLGRRSGVAGEADLRVSQVSGLRRISVAPGASFGGGITTEASGTNVLDLATPTDGIWRIVSLRKTWGDKATVLVSQDVATTSTAVPTTTPAAATIDSVTRSAGSTWEDPLALVWVNSANTTMVIVDLRRFADQRGQGGTTSAREFYYPSATAGQRAALEASGVSWYNTEKRWVERYHDVYNASTNPLGARVAGWYPYGGMLPALVATDAPAVMTATVGGPKPLQFATAETLRNIQFVLGTGTNAGVATITQAGLYQISGSMRVSSINGDMRAYITRNDATTAIQAITGLIGANLSQALVLAAGDKVSVDVYQQSGTANSVTSTQRALSIAYLSAA